MIPTTQTPTTGVLLQLADVVINTASGDLVIKDSTLVSTADSGEFSGIWTVVSGTGIYSGASGVIQITGSFVPGVGETANYVGRLALA